MFCACDGEDWEADDNLLTDVSHGSLTNHHVVATGDVQNITPNSATILCSANYNYKESLGIKPGIIYSDSYGAIPENLRYGRTDILQVEINSFTNSSCEVTLTNLKPTTKYYYRAYAQEEHNGGIHYGEVKSFTTSFDSSIIEAIDLGLSVKWGNINIGASQPEETGKSFYWGQTTASTSKDWHEYTPSTLNNQGYIDGSNNLCPSHDTATDVLGGKWRMPTKDELIELKDKCTWKEVKKNGEDVFLITGPNSNVIYLPIIDYWSSTGSSSSSYCLYLYRKYSYQSYSIYVDTKSRGSYLYIRPVTK